jgi:hypothetical protein
MKSGDLVWVEGWNQPSIFIEWCSDKDPQAEYGMAYLFHNDKVRKEHCDWWQPWNPDKK